MNRRSLLLGLVAAPSALAPPVGDASLLPIGADAQLSGWQYRVDLCAWVAPSGRVVTDFQLVESCYGYWEALSRAVLGEPT